MSTSSVDARLRLSAIHSMSCRTPSLGLLAGPRSVRPVAQTRTKVVSDAKQPSRRPEPRRAKCCGAHGEALCFGLHCNMSVAHQHRVSLGSESTMQGGPDGGSSPVADPNQALRGIAGGAFFPESVPTLGLILSRGMGRDNEAGMRLNISQNSPENSPEIRAAQWGRYGAEAG